MLVIPIPAQDEAHSLIQAAPAFTITDDDLDEAFARLHPTKHFPYVSLLTIGAVTIPFCFFTLGQLVNWLILVQILMGVITAHYGVEGNGFYGIPLAKWLPYAVCSLPCSA